VGDRRIRAPFSTARVMRVHILDAHEDAVPFRRSSPASAHDRNGAIVDHGFGRGPDFAKSNEYGPKPGAASFTSR
jgi:hypothetical protein